MNWYKKAQKLEIEETARYGPNYTDYGHDIYNEEEDVDIYDKNYKPNYMWEYINGEIDIEEETNDIPAHPYVERWKHNNSYSGRYESGRGIITLVKPFDGIARHKDIPSVVQYKLRKAFPEAKKIMVF